MPHPGESTPLLFISELGFKGRAGMDQRARERKGSPGPSEKPVQRSERVARRTRSNR